MVCGNMEVETSSKSFIDNLYDNHEDKVAYNYLDITSQPDNITVIIKLASYHFFIYPTYYSFKSHYHVKFPKRHHCLIA